MCGGRDFQDYRLVEEVLDYADEKGGILFVITGGARGADALAERWCRERGRLCAVVRAAWQHHGKWAGPARNQAMLGLGAEAVIAFPGGAGTADMVRRARAAGVRVWEVRGHEDTRTSH